ncbi:MAG: hypothetical protein IJS97_03090 [Prevotella sp.]|nr:hypothetical protein [Prevotella sp.]
MIDVLLWTTEIMTVAMVALTCWSVWHTLRMRGKTGKTINRIPVKKLSYCVFGTLLAILALTCALSSDAPVKINGEVFTDKLWIRLSGMFVYTIIILMVTASIAVILGKIKYDHKKKTRA